VIKKVKKLKRSKRLNGTLKNSTESALEKYFKTLNGTKPDNLYNLVIREVEAPLMKKIMEYTENNQTQASKILGINRTTLRTKLKAYKLIK
jgi:Fis family transcriptional regulator, factor for inversion stimulation protein